IVLAIADMYDVQGLSHKQIEMLEKLINFYEALGSDALLKVKEYVLALKKAGEHYAKVYNVEKDEYNKNEIKEKAARYIHTALKIQESISQDNAIYADVVLAMSRYLLFTEPGRAETAFKLAKMSFLLFYKNYKQHHIKHIESANLAGFIALYLKNYQEAEKLFALALKATPVLNDNYHIYNLHLHFNLAMTMMYQGKTELAAMELLSGGWVIEEQLKRNFAHLTEKEKEALYKTFSEDILLYAYFVSENYTQLPSLSNMLFNLLLHTKGFIFNQNRVFIKSILQSSDANLKKKFEKWQELKAELARKQQSTNLSERNYYQSGKTHLDNQVERLEKEIASQNAEFLKEVVERVNQKHIDWKEIQVALKNDEALVEIVRTYSFKNGFYQDSAIYFALIIKPTEAMVKLIKLNNGFRMENGNLNYYRNCIRFQKEDKESYNAYWKSIAQELVGVKKVYFCPDGVYHFINPLTLLNPLTNKFVNEEAQVQMISRSADLLEIKKEKVLQTNFENYQMYLFGYPDYSNLPSVKAAEKPKTPKNSLDNRFQKQRFLDLGTGTITSLPAVLKRK
ncbi:MAG: hypothetical protein NZ108_06800, partial [Bacteroidia bacterium]|nr:hypothetical protein [Bacteroidia bacterium]